MSYDTYYDLLINACVRYDKTKKANIGKRRNVYATNIDDTYIDSPTPCIDHVPDSPYGGIDLPPEEFYQVHALSSRHPPSQRPGQPSRPPFRPQSQHSRPTKPIRRYDGPIFRPPQIYKLLSEDAMKTLKAYNTEAITRFHQRKVHNTEIVETPQDDPPGPPVPENDPPDLPESYLDIPHDHILNFVNSQCHNSEDLDQALQAYQAYQVPYPQDSTMTPERSINHHFTYHIAQASQAKHGSLVDRGANGGLAGSDVRILSRSSRKCTVTGIDSHELQGLDVVQCAALVQTNHGIVNLIMNEYACYGKGHTIHSSGQIEWFKNSVDDRSVQVGGKQRICTIDGYAMPLTCRGGLMDLSILGKPTDKDLEKYPAIHLTGPDEWDPSVFDYTHPPEQKAPEVFIRSRDEENPSGSKPMPTFDPSDLIGRTFLLPPEENGERHRAKNTRQVVEIIDQDNGQRVENINFIVDIGIGKVEELISYNQLLELSLDTKVICLPQIQTGKGVNIMFKLNGRLGRLPLDPSPSLLLMIQSHVQHMPKKMTYLLWREGIDSEALPRRIRSLQEQLSKVRSGKSGDLKPICLGISSPEITWRPCNLTQKTRIANGMMPLSLKWNPCQNTKYSKSGKKQSLINIRKSKTLLKVIIGLKCI